MKHILSTITVFFILLTCSVSWSESLTIDDLVYRNDLYYKKFTNDPYTGEISGIENGNIEKGKKKLIEQRNLKVLNTISDVYEFDKEMTLKDGAYGTHLVLSLYPSILDQPNKRIRKLWQTMYWDFGGRPPSYLLEEENQELLLAETLEFVIRDRCPSFIANGDDAIQIDRIDDRMVFKDTGEKGWKGALHYCTKQIFCKDQFLEVFDEKNSNICVA